MFCLKCLKSTQTKKLDSHWDLMRRQRRAIETAPKDSSPTMSNFAKSKEHLESGEKQFEDVRGVSFNIFQYSRRFLMISLSRTGMAMTSVTLFSWCTDLRKSMLKFHCQSVDSERSLSPFHVAMWEGGAGRTIKCTNWCEVAAASKYWWDSGTVDVTHDTVMLVNISESKFPRTARNMPGNSSLRSPVCISRGPCRSLYGSDL